MNITKIAHVGYSHISWMSTEWDGFFLGSFSSKCVAWLHLQCPITGCRTSWRRKDHEIWITLNWSRCQPKKYALSTAWFADVHVVKRNSVKVSNSRVRALGRDEGHVHPHVLGREGLAEADHLKKWIFQISFWNGVAFLCHCWSVPKL